MAKQLLDLSPSKETEEICEAFSYFSEALLSIPIKIPGTAYARGFKVLHGCFINLFIQFIDYYFDLLFGDQ